MQRILLVEDSKFLKIATQRILSKAGYEVLTAEDGLQALQMADHHLPDLILLDMLLPKLDGPQVLALLKSNPSTEPIPVIVLSGLSDKNAPKLLQAGASAFIQKDKALNNPAMLLDIIKKFFPSSHTAGIPFPTSENPSEVLANQSLN